MEVEGSLKPVDILKKLIEFPTFQTTLDRVEEGMKDCARYLSDQLEGLGFRVKVDDLFNVTAERVFGGKKSFLMNTHFDTVAPAKEWVDALTPKLKGKELVGLGASDSKGGIAAALSALSHVDDSRFEKLIVQFVNYEDNGITFEGKRQLGMPYFLGKNPGFKADYGINIEPTVRDNKHTVSLGCTGRVSFTVTTIGKEAHSSTPLRGRNAIYDMTRVVSALRRVPAGRFKMDGFSGVMPVNVALIEGGRALNIVPGECRITCERRVFPNENPDRIVGSIRRAVEGIKGVDARVEFSGNVQPPYIVEKSHEVVRLVVDSAKRAVGYKPMLRIGLGRTDSMYLFHVAGVKTVIMGPGHTGHVIGENINIDRLNEFTGILGTMLKPEA